MSDEKTTSTLQEEDTQLIARCLCNEQTAYADLYNKFIGGVYRLCYSLLFNKQDAEDVSQEAFVYAFKNLARFDADKASFKTWLYTITVSRCRNMYRRKQLPLINFSQVFQLKVAAPKVNSPEAKFAQSSAEDALLASLAMLKPQLREAIALRYGHGLTYREIAEVMNCPPKTAESRVRLAHDKLRRMLGQAGHSLLDELLSF